MDETRDENNKAKGVYEICIGFMMLIAGNYSGCSHYMFDEKSWGFNG